MKVVELQNYGGADALRIAERAVPRPAAGQALVRVAATSLNPMDPNRASGALRAFFPLTFPFVPGGDFAGVVEETGDGVHGLSAGDAVYGHSLHGGAYAEWIAVGADCLEAKPANFNYVEAAAIALVGQTAMQTIEASGIAADKVVLVNGAGGAVGSIVVQLAHQRGATVLAVASEADADRVISYGASRILKRGSSFEALAGSVDVVIDAAGGAAQDGLYSLLRPGGVFVSLSQPPSQEEATRRGVRALMIRTETSRRSLSALRQLAEEGKVIPHIAEATSLWNAMEVWRRYASGGQKGRLVFTV